MNTVDGWILGLLAVSVGLGLIASVVLIAIVENLKDVKAYQFTVIDRLGKLDDQIREGNLRILKCLKGGSYSGSFGGMDIHTSSSIPPGGGGFIFDAKQFEQ